MDILIIENVSMGIAKYGFFDKTLLTIFTILPTLHARRIAAITPKKHRIEVLNERYKKIDFDKKYDIILIDFATSSSKRAYEIADIFKKNKVKVVLSGLHPSLNKEEAKKHTDSLLLGLGELNWLNLLKDYERSTLKKEYPPVKYDKNIKIPPTNINLPGFVLSGAIEATRGCPYGCNFCRETAIPGGSIFYKRPVDEVVDEINSLPQKMFTFYDNSLTIDPTYTKELFKKLKNNKKKFSCNGNSDVLSKDAELVKLSKQAGCVSWLIGFESISQKTIESMGKKTNLVENYKQAVENIHKHKMIAIGCFVFGFDTDNKEIFKETLNLIKKINIDVADFLILTPFPGTPIFKKFEKEKRIITKDWAKYNMKNVVFEPKNMTKEELTYGVKKMYKEFYSLPYSIKRSINSLKYGLYPFFLTFERNLTAHMNSRHLFSKK